MKSSNITATDGRLKQALEKNIKPIQNKAIFSIKNEIENNKLHTGSMSKFYPYLNKAEVKLNKSNKKVVCKILNKYSGGILDLYTPSGESSFCNTLKEPCIIPQGNLPCIVADIENDNEKLLLGYYLVDELVGFSPAPSGNMKLLSIGATNEYHIKFGVNGLDIQSAKKPTINVGEFEDETTELNYASSDDVYTREEVDKLLEDLKEEIINILSTENLD